MFYLNFSQTLLVLLFSHEAVDTLQDLLRLLCGGRDDFVLLDKSKWRPCCISPGN
jgi:hypothetical protein